MYYGNISSASTIESARYKMSRKVTPFNIDDSIDRIGDKTRVSMFRLNAIKLYSELRSERTRNHSSCI